VEENKSSGESSRAFVLPFQNEGAFLFAAKSSFAPLSA
jgi:hypothetical protein